MPFINIELNEDMFQKVEVWLLVFCFTFFQVFCLFVLLFCFLFSNYYLGKFLYFLNK